MPAVPTRLPVALALAGIVLATGSAGASPRASTAGAAARASAIRVLVPGQPGAERVVVSAPPDTVGFASGFSYPDDGSVVTTGSLTASASTDTGATAAATASSEVSSLSLFGGEVTVGTITARAKAATQGRRASGDVTGSGVSGLTVLGQAVAATSSARVTLGDWGYASVLEQASTPGSSGGAQTYDGYVTALDIHLTAAHGGLPAGSEIQAGYAKVSVQAGTPPKPIAKKRSKRQPKPPEPKGLPGGPPVQRAPPGLQPKLTAGGYVFPVYGPSSFTDTFGAPRADTGWHHGDDIFAPLGAPLLACADGTVFSVGWNDIGGNRLWLRDAQGNEFYYAHLSAFSPLAVNGKHVKAGEVVGFVGNTGDAEGTPYHLHFEVHPVSLLYLGYDGAVDPTPYLIAWKHLQDVRFTAVAGWVPAVAPSSPAPKPGAILLQVSDISEGSGLEPGSLQRAMAAPVSSEGDAALLRAPIPRAG